MSEKEKGVGIKIVCDNRKAGHNYFLEDRIEAAYLLARAQFAEREEGKKEE